MFDFGIVMFENRVGGEKNDRDLLKRYFKSLLCTGYSTNLACIIETSKYKCHRKKPQCFRITFISVIYMFCFVSVNGGWSPWGPWVECRCPGATLSTGKMSTRTCTNPPPSNGGQNCQGLGIRRTKDCIPCPQGNLTFLLFKRKY